MFYLRYAARNLWRGGRWSLFAIFCIAAGVATVVALRSLGLAIGDSLVANVRASNHGDIRLVKGESYGPFAAIAVEGNSSQPRNAFQPDQLERLKQWAAERDGRMTAYLEASNIQVTAVDFSTVGRPQFISSFFIDPQTFPPTEDIVALDPPGVPLRELFTGGNEVVISKNLADSQGLAAGDTVRVSGTAAEFTVRGVVATEYEANLQNIFASFFGFAYFDLAIADKLGIDPAPNRVAITLPEGADIEAAADDLPWRGMGVSSVFTVPELIEERQEIGQVIGDFIVVMGLGALLIGGVGIINTMLVVVGRRTMEIASLKTFGLKGRQVALLFLAEALWLGVLGSITGSTAGVLMSGAVNKYGEAFLQQPLVWRVYPEALLYGLGLGVIVSLVFGVLPVLTAAKVRPAIILRPNETHIPGVGVLHAIFALLVVIVVAGLIVGRIVSPTFELMSRAPSPYLLGIIGVAVTLAILGVLVGLMWLVVWVMSHLPSFGIVDLRLALRNLTTRRIRTATTLLALSAGMFALSSITFFGVGVREVMQFQLTENAGGNVLVFHIASLASPQLGQTLLDAQLAGIQGISYRTRLDFYDPTIEAIDGHEPEFLNPFFDEMADEMEAEMGPRGGRFRDNLFDLPVSVATTDNPNPPERNVVAGRDLTPEDEGQQVMIVTQTPFTDALGIQLGSVLTLRLNGRQLDFEVVGLVSGEQFGGGNFVPAGSLGNVRPDFSFNVLQVPPENLNQVLLDLSALPLVFSLDISFIDGLIKRLMDQFSAIPTLVGLLSLLAAAVIMANTVSLATLERRRQIGILKTIGLKGRRVLMVMLLENTFIGLIGGLIGIGLSAVGVAYMTSVGIGEAIPIPKDAAPIAIGLLAASVLIAWIATFLSARVAINERVTNVLRYE